MIDKSPMRAYYDEQRTNNKRGASRDSNLPRPTKPIPVSAHFYNIDGQRKR